ncbi:MAG: hypothetical protein LCH38_08000 [Proteobacteria bacterium]|nr:hypothetical protein [Pseudomonadota bacterium]
MPVFSSFRPKARQFGNTEATSGKILNGGRTNHARISDASHTPVCSRPRSSQDQGATHEILLIPSIRDRAFSPKQDSGAIKTEKPESSGKKKIFAQYFYTARILTSQEILYLPHEAGTKHRRIRFFDSHGAAFAPKSPSVAKA